MDSAKRNRFWQLHSLLGIGLGLPLFVIFVAGTLAFFEPQAVNWTHPHFIAPPPVAADLDPTIAALLEKHPATDELLVSLASADHPVIDLYLEENHQPTHYWIDPHTLEIAPAPPHDADLFHFFVDLHYFDFIPYGRELTGIIAALFFTIIVTGAVYQWRSIRRDAHPRNLSLANKNRWKNIHRFSSLFTLPFQALYSATGAALALGLLLASPAVYLFFDGKADELNRTLFPAYVHQPPPSAGRPPFPVDQALAIARSHWPDHVSPVRLRLANLAATDAAPAFRSIVVEGKAQGVHFIGSYILTFDDELNILHDQLPASHFAPAVIEGIVNLHFGTFDALAIKAVFAAAGLVVSLSIAAGVLIFLRRHQQGSSKDSHGTRLLRTLTHWILGGLPLAIALSLHAAHLLPDAPVVSFAVVIAASLAATSIFRNALSVQAKLAAAAFLALPLTFAIVQQQSPFQWGSTHAALVTAFNSAFILIAVGIQMLVIKLSARPNP